MKKSWQKPKKKQKTQRRRGNSQHILTPQLRSKTNFTSQRCSEEFESWLDAWLTLLEILQQISVKRLLEKSKCTKNLSLCLILEKLVSIMFKKIYTVDNAKKWKIPGVLKHVTCKKFRASKWPIIVGKMSKQLQFFSSPMSCLLI